MPADGYTAISGLLVCYALYLCLFPGTSGFAQPHFTEIKDSIFSAADARCFFMAFRASPPFPEDTA